MGSNAGSASRMILTACGLCAIIRPTDAEIDAPCRIRSVVAERILDAESNPPRRSIDARKRHMASRRTFLKTAALAVRSLLAPNGQRILGADEQAPAPFRPNGCPHRLRGTVTLTIGKRDGGGGARHCHILADELGADYHVRSCRHRPTRNSKISAPGSGSMKMAG